MCHKAGILHLRVPDPANDFYCISPKDPFSDGSGFKAYIPEGVEGSWHFCERCGTRPFAVGGNGYHDDSVDMPTSLLQRLNSRTLNGTTGDLTAQEGETTRITAWRPSKDWIEYSDDGTIGNGSLSINAITIDAHNENWDLAQLQKNGYVSYMQTLQYVGNDHEDKPYFGGMW